MALGVNETQEEGAESYTAQNQVKDDLALGRECKQVCKISL
jgi:hypothetical protein